jgi:hypothetical protein
MGDERSFIAIDDISIDRNECEKNIESSTETTTKSTTSVTTISWQTFIDKIKIEVNYMNEILLDLSKQITNASMTIKEDIRKLNEVSLQMNSNK